MKQVKSGSFLIEKNMSGVYLTVWDTQDRDATPILRVTKGGWPHITIAYMGSKFSHADLCDLCISAFRYFCTKQVTLTTAYVNEFFEEKTGLVRFDVLLSLATEDEADVEGFRTRTIRTVWPNVAMHKPHVTHAIFYTRAAAETIAADLNESYLPCTVQITGVTLN